MNENNYPNKRGDSVIKNIENIVCHDTFLSKTHQLDWQTIDFRVPALQQQM